MEFAVDRGGAEQQLGEGLIEQGRNLLAGPVGADEVHIWISEFLAKRKVRNADKCQCHYQRARIDEERDDCLP